MSRVEEGTEGSGSSINETMMNLGATVGMVLFIALFFIFISVTDLKSLTPSDVVSGFSQVFMAATLLPLLAFLCCLAIRLRRGEKNGLPAGGEAGSKTSK
jgi:hypothetical protein